MLGKVREYINAHQNKQILGLILILVILIALPLTVIISQQRQEIRQRASEPESSYFFPQVTVPEGAFKEGEVLVKFKATAPPIKPKEDKGEVSILNFEEAVSPSVLDTINQKYKIKTIEKVFKEKESQAKIQALSDRESALLRVYKLELESPSAPIQEIIEELKKDAQVEYAEPNFIVTAIQNTSPAGGSSPSRVFITSTTYNGNLGGLAGADAKCQGRASAANLGGVWKAWLSDNTTPVTSRFFQSPGTYQRLDKTVIANNWNDLVDGTNLISSISISEFGNDWTNYLVWSNTDSNGDKDSRRIYEGSGHCNNWTSASDSDFGRMGVAKAKSPDWTSDPIASSKPCNASFMHLYCFEQIGAIPTPLPTSAPTLTIAPSPTKPPISTPTPTTKPTPTPFLTPTITPTPIPGKGPNDLYYPQMWGLQKIQMEQAWETTKGSNNVVVAVIDTGIDYTHPELGGSPFPNQRVTSGYDFAYNDNDPMDPTDGHGTHVAGTIGALVNNGVGISGINWDIKLMAVKVLNDSGGGTISAVAQGIIYAADNGAKVINMSLGVSIRCSSSQTFQDAISYAREKGVTVVVAAGNSNTDASGFSPASCNGVIAVAATGPTDERSYYSNYGSIVDIAAPGGDKHKCSDKISCLIHSTIPNNRYDFYQGTSMASPHVAGVAALLLAKNSSLTPDQVETMIKDYGDAIATDKPIGKRLNANNSLLGQILPPRPTATPTPTPPPVPPTPTPTPTIIPTPIPPSQSYNRVFITSNNYIGGTLKGLSGADAKCQERADDAKLGGTWKAWLSDSTISAASRLVHSNKPYKLINGTPVANDWSDLTDGLLTNSINLNEFNKPNGELFVWVWTGSFPDGSIPRANDQYTCYNWTRSYDSSKPPTLATIGDSLQKDGHWSNSTITHCTNAYQLYCFEQIADSVVSPTPSNFCTPCSADINRDGKVNRTDAKTIRVCLNKPITGTCINGDINKNGKIDITDLNCTLRNIGKKCVLPSP